jgi:hypothetical protein
MTRPQLDLRGQRMLLADWFAHLARAAGLDLTQHGTSGQAFTVGAQNAFHVTAHFTDSSPFLDFIASDASRQSVVNAIVAKAIDRVERHDLGDTVWYSTGLHEVEFKPSAFSLMGPLLQRLGRNGRQRRNRLRELCH